MSAVCRLRTAAWYGDRVVELPVPDGWDLAINAPRTPPPLSDSEIDAALRDPVGQEPISRLAADRARPLIIVDDLTRPTPADRIVPAAGQDSHGYPCREATIELGKQLGQQVIDLPGGHVGCIAQPAKFAAELLQALSDRNS